MTPIVSIVGLSGSGKTTLIVKVVSELKKRGYRVAVLKHDAHGFEIDHKGKDSYRHKKAGASTVALSSPKKFAVIRDVKTEWAPERIIRSFLLNADIVITEGYKKADFPKIEVFRKEVSTKPVCLKDKRLMALAGDTRPKGLNVPFYGIDDFKGIATLIEKTVIKKYRKETVSLLVDGRTVMLKPFIEALLREGVLGMVKSLKGCSNPKEIYLRVQKG
ncbi:MAG: molybdopterin-guanine dinucleotide biosynthesis protein B [Deltaproteobacteria bacterium]|nr:molybdopterin-guanine dinucleotide biosynthesis protein B [Deltaproteobacteria bacterium]